MIAKNFSRYIWLIDTLRKHPKITFERISDLWAESSTGDGTALSWRTFMEHKKRCEELFCIDIKCDRHHGYTYYIEDSDSLEGKDFRSWLIDSYSVLNQVQSDRRLSGRIIFEDVPSGNTWLTTLSEAISKSRVVEITHQSFGKAEPKTFEIEPYYLKVVKRRWYLIGRSIGYSETNRQLNLKDGGARTEDVFRIYALDRITQVNITDKHFEMSEDFDIEEYFEGCMGVIPNDGKLANVVIRAYGSGPAYLRSLPLHPSQKEIKTNKDGSVDFICHICPNNDFIQSILMQGSLVEVVSPKWVRDKVKEAVESIYRHYS